MEIRTYCSGDEGVLVSLWNRRVAGCYATAPLSPERFLTDVVGKQYFEPEGLAIALGGDRPIAFAHAGFRSSDWIHPDYILGTISMVAVEHDALDAGVGVVAEAVRYLFRRGAKQVEAFTIDFPNTPFYNGLYGGEKAGMDEDHPAGLDLMDRCHFRISTGAVILVHDLDGGADPGVLPPGLRLQVAPWPTPMAGRPATECYGIPEVLRRASLLDSTGAEKAGIAFWHLDRYNGASRDRLAVVSHVGCAPELRGTGAAAFLQRTVHQILRDEGARRVGLGANARNGRAIGFYQKIGYRPVKNAYQFFLDWRHVPESR